MKQVVTEAIVLSRIEYGEADRILTIITPDQGKVRLLAKGVRRPASKLAGGIELFSVSHITYLLASGELRKLVSSRLITHYGDIVKDLDRTMLGYRLLKILNRATEEAPGGEYYTLVKRALEGLNDLQLDRRMVELWFFAQLTALAGRTPNLRQDSAGSKFEETARYLFDFEAMAFGKQLGGRYRAHHVKLLRLAFAVDKPHVLGQVRGADELVDDCTRLITSILSEFMKV